MNKLINDDFSTIVVNPPSNPLESGSQGFPLLLILYYKLSLQSLLRKMTASSIYTISENQNSLSELQLALAS